jgi:hypothetical protein
LRSTSFFEGHPLAEQSPNITNNNFTAASGRKQLLIACRSPLLAVSLTPFEQIRGVWTGLQQRTIVALINDTAAPNARKSIMETKGGDGHDGTGKAVLEFTFCERAGSP